MRECTIVQLLISFCAFHYNPALRARENKVTGWELVEKDAGRER